MPVPIITIIPGRVITSGQRALPPRGELRPGQFIYLLPMVDYA